MPPKVTATKSPNEQKKNVLVIPSRVISRPDELEGGEETEIAAQISVPEEGGWGWVVVIACFWAIFALDGVTFTYGSLIQDIAQDLNIDDSKAAFVNSLAIALYFIAAPLGSAFINRFGFRSCAMSGSVIVTFSLVCSYFSTNYASLCVFYGALAGLGYCLINLSCGLIVGFYFEKLRSLALSIATTGSSVGIMVLFPVNTYLVGLAGWRVTTLLHSGLFGLVYFMAMTFRPVLSLTVVKTTDDPTRTVTYLPNVAAAVETASRTKVEGLVPTAAERLFSAVSNANFPTVASVVEEEFSPSPTQPGPSSAHVSKITLTAYSPQGGISKRQLKQVQSIISRTSVQDKSKKNVEITLNVQTPKKRSFWARLCHWEQHVPEARPMYRDDAFYQGNIEKLPVYQKSMMDTAAEARTGLEYQMAVSRAVTAGDLKERRGVFTTAARRVLATMMDPSLLSRNSFRIMCISAIITYMGYLVPYVYIQDRTVHAGIDPQHCNLFVSVIGLSNAVGRLCIGVLAVKIDPIVLYSLACIVSGIMTIFSDMSFSLLYQYVYATVFGFFVSSLSCLRSMVIVDLFGLDKLTNATGIILLFQGLGSLVSTPMAGIIKNKYGYSVSFYVAGVCLTLGGSLLLFVKIIAAKQKKREARNKTDRSTKRRT